MLENYQTSNVSQVSHSNCYLFQIQPKLTFDLIYNLEYFPIFLNFDPSLVKQSSLSLFSFPDCLGVEHLEQLKNQDTINLQLLKILSLLTAKVKVKRKNIVTHYVEAFIKSHSYFYDSISPKGPSILDVGKFSQFLTLPFQQNAYEGDF